MKDSDRTTTPEERVYEAPAIDEVGSVASMTREADADSVTTTVADDG